MSSIKFEKISEEEYDFFYLKCKYASVVGTSSYANSKLGLDNFKNAWYLITRNSEILGICQLRTRRVGIFELNLINRGLIFVTEPTSNELNNIYRFFCHNYGRLRKLQFLLIKPESFDLNYNVRVLKKQKCTELYFLNKQRTLILDLAPSEMVIFSTLKPKWRNLLRSAQKTIDVQIAESINDLEKFNALMNLVNINLKNKNAKCHNTALYNNFARDLIRKGGEVIITEARYNNEVIGSVCVILYGKTATYFLGWSNDMGRNYKVNYSLLWETIIHVKNMGAITFDLGGIDSKLPGITHFKTGLNGQEYFIGKYFLSFNI